MKNTIPLIALFSSLITLGALIAHLLSLPAKMRLPAQEYLMVQGIYRGWAWIGVFEILALVLTIVWAARAYHDKEQFSFLLPAAVCLAVSLALFFIYTFPANRATLNWTQLPDHWQMLRKRWEYSHMARAILNLAGFCLLLIMLLKKPS